MAALHKEIIVNVTPRETRIAVLEEGQLMELRVEREERVVGNIYKGVVQNVLPGMDAAFVDIGLERNAFLYVADILPDEDSPEFNQNYTRATLRKRKIAELLKTGQEILVQVIKGPRGAKGARVSTRLTLPGRFIVLMPNGSSFGVSRKIDSRDERDRLRAIAHKNIPSGFGIIIRTEAEGKDEKDICADIDFLKQTWLDLQRMDRQTRAPGLVHRDVTLLYRTIRDVFSSDVHRILIDDPDEYEKVYQLIRHLAPQAANRVHFYDKPEPIFDMFNIEKEMERLIHRKVWLKSGGYLSIDETEALTSIDINSGKFVGQTSLAETIVKMNLEAVDEACRQIRLRDIGGIIVIDFIDMANPKDRKTVIQSLEKHLARDRAKTRIGKVSSLGLVEITRKRTGESVTETITTSCPFCHGRGRMPSADTVSLWVERDMRRQIDKPGDAFYIEAHASVVENLIGIDGENIESLEHTLRRGIFVRSRNDFTVDRYTITNGNMTEFERQYLTYRRAQVIDCDVAASVLQSGQPPKAVGWANGYFLDLSDGAEYIGKHVKACLHDVRRSYSVADVIVSGPIAKQSVP